MAVTTETFNLLLDKIDALSALLNHKIDTIEAKGASTESKLSEHEGWLKRHDKDISCLHEVKKHRARPMITEITVRL